MDDCYANRNSCNYSKSNKTIQQLDLRNDLIQKNVHLVCLAKNELSVFNQYVVDKLGISNNEATRHVKTVNTKNEAGTLFPKYNITIVPLSIYENRNDFGNRAIFEKHVQDCFKANEKYIKCEKIIFGFEQNDDFDVVLFEEVLSEKAENYNFIQTKEILFCRV